ncbi:MAG: pfkA [Clostridia bacterium]|jgi:6-phosphofructokinase 1|nr:pfkA [Clostridia bacterium]
MRNIAVLTSGGDAPGMNAAIRAVVRSGINSGFRVFGIKRGYNGLIQGDIQEMHMSSVADIIQRGGTILRTARSEEMRTPEGIAKAVNVANVFNIEGIVIIGGDGSFAGAQKLTESGIDCIGIPGTIDNDLAYTDFTIGFDTAVNNVLDAVNKIRDTSTSHERVSIIEVMGRHCGDIALHAGIAGGAESIIVPEVEFSVDEICRKLLQGKSRGKLHSIIILAEGAGDGIDLEKQIASKVDMEVRTTILGYIQRGGNASAVDRLLASRMGAKAVELLKEGKSGKVVGIKENRIFDMDIHEALAMKRVFHKDLLQLSDILSNNIGD